MLMTLKGCVPIASIEGSPSKAAAPYEFRLCSMGRSFGAGRSNRPAPTTQRRRRDSLLRQIFKLPAGTEARADGSAWRETTAGLCVTD